VTLFDSAATAPKAAAPPGPLVRVKAVVAYDGSGFAGFAAQPPGVRTVAGALSSATAKVLGHPVELTCAGRTDAGVHAWGQVVSFDASVERFDPVKLQRSVNKLLAPAIVLRSVAPAEDVDFNARFSAVTRRYRYTILNDPVADPFLAGTAWWVPQALDVRLLRLACDPLIGEHDFASFCRRPDREDASLVRRVLDARWDVEDGGRVLRFWIEANAFCHQMVRAITGTIVECGLGKRHPGDITTILRALDRSAAGTVAPPHGLCLWEVTY
jgi:tRNA pseudouridine38-40 synthase